MPIQRADVTSLHIYLNAGKEEKRRPFCDRIKLDDKKFYSQCTDWSMEYAGGLLFIADMLMQKSRIYVHQ